MDKHRHSSVKEDFSLLSVKRLCTKNSVIICGLLYIIICICLSSGTPVPPTSPTPTTPHVPTDDEQSINILTFYGYLREIPEGATVTIQELEDAIKLYQSYHGLDQSGKFDDDTQDQMRRPRCGNPDKITSHSGRWRRYAATSGWSKTHITWNVVNYTMDLTEEQVDEALTEAFELWSDNTVLSFQRVNGVSEAAVDIQIDFSQPYIEHGDDLPFDGPGHVLAHAFLPWFSRLKGDIHFDDGETWTHRSYSGANLWLVAAHEIGHSLGLQHSFIQGSLMYPYHSGYNPDYTLHEDDIDGIISMYGDGTDRFVTQQPGPPNNPTVPRLCKESFDAIDVAVDGYTYVYKGDYYWRLEQGQIMDGYPKLISQGWPGLQSNIDAAVTVKNSFLWKDEVGKTFFFKGRAVWRYTGRSLDIGYPKDLSTAFPGFPNEVQSVNAAVEINGNGQTFFLTDGVFYLHTYRTGRLPGERTVEGPYSINAFNMIPDNLADAVQLQDNYMYFFTNDMQYFQVSPWTFTPSYSYPKATTDDWFACEGAAQPIRVEAPSSDTKDSNSASLPLYRINTALFLFIISLVLR